MTKLCHSSIHFSKLFPYIKLYSSNLTKSVQNTILNKTYGLLIDLVWPGNDKTFTAVNETISCSDTCGCDGHRCTYKMFGTERSCTPPKSWGYLNMRKKYRCPTTMPNSSIIPLQNSISDMRLLVVAFS